MNTRSIFSYWHFHSAVVIFLILITCIYLYAIYFKASKKLICFFSGVCLVVLCAASPLHFVGENYLFSAHMVNHIILLLIAGPLLVAAIPEDNRFKNSLLIFSEKIYRWPFFSWFIGVGIMWLWHIPKIFNKLIDMPAMTGQTDHRMSPLMNLHMLSLLLSGMLFCWPIISPYEQWRIRPLKGVLYLSSACLFCSLLGLIITFAPPGVYTHHINAHDTADQQAGGLIMWVPCCFIYLSTSMVLLIRWLEDKKEVSATTKRMADLK